MNRGRSWGFGWALLCAGLVSSIVAAESGRAPIREEGLTPTLAVDGVCGEPPRVTVRRATPHGSVELLSARREGSAPIPVGPCAGVRTALSAPIRLLSQLADADGEVSAVLDVPLRDCRPLLQVLDTESCETSEIAMIDRLQILREGKFSAPNAARNDSFGTSVDVEGDTVLLGVPTELATGSAWIYERTGSEWSAAFELVPPHPEGLAELGLSVALEGDIAVVGGAGCTEYFSDPGMVWIFQRDDGPEPWISTVRLTASDGVDRDRFGTSVSAEGDLIAVGAPEARAFQADHGAAYLYRRDAGGPGAWGEVAKLEAPDGDDEDKFGRSVALANGLLAVGAPGDSDGGFASGSVYLFEEEAGGDWILKAKLTASDASGFDEFGSAVAVDGLWVVVGALWANREGQTNAGTVYVFERQAGTDVWAEVAILAPAEVGRASPRFGASIDVEGSLVAVGELGDAGGNAYVFQEVGGRWVQMARLAPRHLESRDEFGGGVALDGDTLLVGASGDDSVEENAGAAFALRWARPLAALSTDGDCPGSVKLTASGATPHASLALLSGSPGGSSSVKVADCPAVNLDLDDPVLAGFAVADAWGRATAALSMSRHDCGRAVQVVDLATCNATDPPGTATARENR